MATKQSKSAPKINKTEQVGFHKGSLATLAKERQELQRMLAIVEQLMHMHIAELQKLGVDLTEQQPKQKSEVKKAPKKPIEDLLK